MVVYAPVTQTSEIRKIASNMRELHVDPELLKSMQTALIEAKGALSASVDENTKQMALSSVVRVLNKFRDQDVPI